MPLTMRVPIWLGGTGSVSKVTRETGGEIIDVERVGSLDAALATAISRLKLRYTWAISPPKIPVTGPFARSPFDSASNFGRLDQDYSVHAGGAIILPSKKLQLTAAQAHKRPKIEDRGSRIAM